ncbi:ATP-binding protein [Paenibacillus sp. FSL P2-0089]|uniref:ATP-binding protein n=1 Tax=Paenibacillus sp. FSL P2-0089 TaxID=2954526 RepID=UPI00315A1337
MLQSTLRMESIYDIHEWLNRCAEIKKELDTAVNLYVELGKLKWVSPAGITVLLSTLNYMDNYYYLKTGAPSYEMTDRFDILGYLERMNFLKLCPTDVKDSFEETNNMEAYYHRNRHKKDDELDELRLSKSDDDIVDLDRSVKKIMRAKGLHRNRVTDIAGIVTELGQNAVEHAATDSYSCVQYYKKSRTRPERVEIAICDTGPGIVKSLKNHINYKNNHDIVKQAIFTRATSKPEQDRGKGLMDVKQTTFINKLNAEGI